MIPAKRLALATAIGGLVAGTSSVRAAVVGYSMYDVYTGNGYHLADLPVDDPIAYVNLDTNPNPPDWRDASGALIDKPHYGWSYGGGLPATWYVKLGASDSAKVTAQDFVQARKVGGFSADGSDPPALVVGYAAYLNWEEANKATSWGHNADFGLLHLDADADVVIAVSGISEASGELIYGAKADLSPGFVLWKGWDSGTGTRAGTRHTNYLESGAPAPGFSYADNPFSPPAVSMTLGGLGRGPSNIKALIKGTDYADIAATEGELASGASAFTHVAAGTAAMKLTHLKAGDYTIVIGGFCGRAGNVATGEPQCGRASPFLQYKVSFTATAVITNSPPTGSVTISGTPQQGQTLTASNTLADADGPATLSISYQWKANGVAIAGATGATYVPTAGDVGKTLTVTASYTDGKGNAESVTSAPTAAVTAPANNSNNPPTGSVTISGTPRQGQTLTASNTLADADGPATLSIGYQWKANGVAIAGATGATYVPTAGDVGKTLTVTASYTDGKGNAESVTSAATAAVTAPGNSPPAFSFSGSFTQDDDVRLFSFTADGSTPVEIKTGSYVQGGFDPLLTLFDAHGQQLGTLEPNGHLNDDGDNGGPCSLVAADAVTQLCLDALYRGVLPAGQYWLALTESNNYSASLDLADGFTWDGRGNVSGIQFGCSNGKFCDYAGNNRTGAWSLDITGAQAVKDEPLFFDANQAPVYTVTGPIMLSIPVDNGAVDLRRFLHVHDADSGQTEVWTMVLPPAQGALAVTDATAASGSADIVPGGTLAYTPKANYVGRDRFDIQVSDGSDTAIQTFFVEMTHVNIPPKFVGGTTTLVVPVNGAAVDLGPNLHVSDTDVVQTLAWTEVSAPAHGTLTVDGATSAAGGTDIAPGGILTYTPAAGHSGTDSFAIQVSDGTATAVRTFAVVIDSNLPPTAIAGPDQSVNEGATVSLDGGQSNDPEGTPLGYQWTQTEGPSVELQPDARSVRPSFTAPQVNTDTELTLLTFNLVVTDSDPDHPKTSDAATTHVLVRNILPGIPTANAGGDFAVAGGTLVTLDGSQSSDPDPGQTKTLRYQWTLVSSTPEGVAVTLGDPTAVKPVFMAPQTDAKLSFRLVVTDVDGHDSTPAAVTVTVKKNNTPPEAHAAAVGGNTVRAGAVKTLDGGASFDADGDALTYVWSQTGGPAVELSSTTAARPTFTAPPNAAGQTLTFSLKVNDGSADSNAAAVSVRITDDNNPPVVKIIAQPVREGEEVTLNSTAIDPDGDAIAAYLWQQVGGTPVVLTKVDGPSLTFTVPMVGSGSGSVSFSLTATDDYAPNPKSAPDVVVVRVDHDPSRLDCSEAYPDRATLWPANKNLVPVRIFGIAGPNPYSLTVTGITSDEPVKDRAAKDTTGPDAKIKRGKAAKARPQATDTLLLRAERQMKRPNGAGSGNGRVYEASFLASDGTQSCTGKVRIEVPAYAGQTAVDDGWKYDALKKK